jgi:hypothetical protein
MFNSIEHLIWLWLLLLSVLMGLLIRRGARGGVFLLTYFVGLSLIHVPGALIYLGSAANLVESAETLLGFQATLLGLSFLLLGAWVARMVPVKSQSFNIMSDLNYLQLGMRLVVLGLGVYFVAMPVLAFIPSATAVVSAGGSLLPLGFWCWLYGAHGTQNKKRFFLAMALMPILPLLTMISGGFIGYGVYWMLTIAAFIYCLLPHKKWYLLLSPLIVLIGLSFAVTYFGERNALRESVWIEQASIVNRLERVGDMITKFKLIDIDDPEHVTPINNRLNQNILVGLAIERHHGNVIDLAYGTTVPLWIVIPRAVWPDKPPVGGSGDIVSKATGLVFAQYTSVGVGQPLEFYINFGWNGIVIGFTLLGYLLMRLDVLLALAFKRRDVKAILFSALPGLALMQPGGSLMEIIVAFIGALGAAYLVNRYLKRPGVLHKRAAQANQRVLHERA